MDFVVQPLVMLQVLRVIMFNKTTYREQLALHNIKKLLTIKSDLIKMSKRSGDVTDNCLKLVISEIQSR